MEGLPPSVIACFAALNLSTGMMLYSFKAFGPTLEEIYGLSGIMTGLLVSFPEIGYLLSLLPVALLASKFPRPRIIGIGCLSMAVGAGLFCLPLFVCSERVPGSSASRGEDMAHYLCRKNADNFSAATGRNNTEDAITTASGHPCGLSKVHALFLSGALLVGIGASPATTLHFSYIDDHVNRAKSPIFLGIIQASTLLGILFSYLVAGLLTKYDAASSHHDVRWWISFLISSVGCLLSSLRFWCLNDSPEIIGNTNDESSSFTSSLETEGQENPFSGLLESWESSKEEMHPVHTGPSMSMRRLASDPCMLITLLVITCWHFPPILNGTFILQYIHLQFGLPLSSSSFSVGVITGLPALVGIPAGGFLASRASVKVKDLASYVLVFTAVACFTIPIGCSSNEDLTSLAKGIDPNCGEVCGCQDITELHLVCCEDETSYSSPCHAGCGALGNSTQATVQIFAECGCVATSTQTLNSTTVCTTGPCKKSCPIHNFVTFSFVLMMKVTLGCLAYIPYGMMLMRCVHPADKAVIIALKELFGKFLGDMTGSITIGKLFDTACLIHAADSRAECSLYDLDSLKVKYFWMSLLPLLCAVVILIMTTIRLSMRDCDARLRCQQ